MQTVTHKEFRAHVQDAEARLGKLATVVTTCPGYNQWFIGAVLVGTVKLGTRPVYMVRST